MRTLTKIALGGGLLALTGYLIHLGMKSSAASDQLLAAYQRLPARDRFVGMLYLTAEQDGQLLPAEDVSQAVRGANPAAVLVMELFTQTSAADRRTFVDLVFLPYGGSTTEKAFTIGDVRQVRRLLDERKIVYSSPETLKILSAEFPAIAVQLGIPRA